MIVLVVVGILHAGGAQAAKPSSDIVTIDICPSSRAHFRNDWSLVFPLKQGRLMLVWCEYYATSPEQVINRRKSNYTDPAAVSYTHLTLPTICTV